MLAGHAGDAIVFGQPAIQERELRVDQVGETEVLTDQLGEEQRGFASDRVAEQFVVFGVELFVRRGGVDLVEPQPLAKEVVDEPGRFLVVEHPVDLTGEHLGIREPGLAGQLEKLGIGHALPEEVRETVGQGVVVQLAGLLGKDHELWGTQHRTE